MNDLLELNKEERRKFLKLRLSNSFYDSLVYLEADKIEQYIKNQKLFDNPNFNISNLKIKINSDYEKLLKKYLPRNKYTTNVTFDYEKDCFQILLVYSKENNNEDFLQLEIVIK
jgi:hypothetical protein